MINSLPSIHINGRDIGQGRPAYIVAEMSANHNGNFERAVAIIQAAKKAGADAIKLQTYTADTMTLDCRNEHFLISGGTLWDGQNLHSLYQQAYTPWEWQKKLQDVARGLELDFFSTPFDESAVAFLEDLDVPVHKIASFELNDPSLLTVIAKTGKPVIMSTGMATLAEIAEAVQTLRENGCTQLALLHCVSSYPAPAADMNLRTIAHLAETFSVVAGLSDHSMGETVAIAAVALGACIVEKHLTLHRADGGPDSGFSMEPDEFAAMVKGIRTVEAATGQITYSLTDSQKACRKFRRSLFAATDIEEGSPFTRENVRCVRPAAGLSPRHLQTVLQKKAACTISKGTALSWELIK